MSTSAIRILYFGPARERVGSESEVIDVATPIDIDSLWSHLIDRHPSLQTIRSSCRLAIDMQYAETGDCVNTGSEVAILPPVAGG